MRWGPGSPGRQAVPAVQGRAARCAFAAVVLAAAAGRLVHAFDAPGSYVVAGYAIGLGGSVSDSVALTVH